MNFNVRTIGHSQLQEVSVDTIETGALNEKEAIRLAQQMVSVAEDLLYVVGLRANSDACGTIVEDLTEYL